MRSHFDAPPVGEQDILSAMFNVGSIALMAVNGAGTIVMANAAVTNLLGYSPQALRGRSVEVLLPETVRGIYAFHREAYLRNPAERPIVGTSSAMVALHADGREVPVEVALSPMRIHGDPYLKVTMRGRMVDPRVVLAMRRAHYYEQLAILTHQAVDLTDPHEFLQRAPAFVAEALECEGCLVYLLEPNHRELRVVSAFGLTGGRKPGLVVPIQADSAVGFVVQQRGVVVISDFADERRFLLPPSVPKHGVKSGLGVPLFDKGQVVGVISISSMKANHFGHYEIQFLQAVASVMATSLQREKMEAQLRQAAKMESIGQLTGGIAHDFNNILTVIQGNLQMAQERLEVQDSAKALELLEMTNGASRRAAELTNKLLTISRRQVLNPRLIDLSELLPSVVDLLRRTLGENIAIVVNVAPECPPCLADNAQLEAALLNIAINARDAMPEGGTLSFACRLSQELTPKAFGNRLELPSGELTSWVCLSITDTGCGMTSTELERAFEPFFTTKGAGRGTGLGLSSVYGFVRQSKGHVTLESSPGVGTTVTLLLPCGSGEFSAVAAPQKGATVLPAGLRVLLVEDDALVRLISQEFLESLNCEVSPHAGSGSAWLELVQGIEFDLLMTDIDLGIGETGPEFARRARSLHPNLPVLLNSGHAAYINDDRMNAPRRWPFLKKPFSREDMATAIAAALAPES